MREYADHIDFYLNNYRSDTTTVVTETIVIKGAKAKPTYTMELGLRSKGTATDRWDASTAEYTLTVNHRGGVNLTVNCAGNAINRRAGAPAITPLAQPKQPEAYHGEIIIEAENMDYKNVKQVYIEQTEENDWRKATFTANLKTGENELVLMNTGGLGMYIDQVIYMPTDVEEPKYAVVVREVENGTVTASVGEANEGDLVKLTVTPNDGYRLKELRVVNGVYYTLGKTISIESYDEKNATLSFEMPDANGSTAYDVTAAQKAELQFTVNTAGNYLIRFVNLTTAGWGEFLLLDCVVAAVGSTNGIDLVSPDGAEVIAIYGVGGERRTSLKRGLNIVRTADGEVKKVMVK